jgi:iron-sulfur cluster assembly protein
MNMMSSEPLQPNPPPDSKRELSIEVTPKAVEAIKAQIAKRDGTSRASSERGPQPVTSPRAGAPGPPATSLRVGIKGGGCSGFSYVIQFHDGPPNARDKVFDYVAEDGTPVRVVSDPKSLIYLNGAVLDWEKTLMQQGFKWRNPQEKSSCGCGHSFNV